MAELSGFWTTSGAPAGHQQASYTQAHWSTAAAILAACSGFEGVGPGYLHSLVGTVTALETVSINDGGAVVDGKWYINDAPADQHITAALGMGNTRIDRIVVRCTWADFHAELHVVGGEDAAVPTIPPFDNAAHCWNTSGTTYDILLYQALVDTAGTVTLTDERAFAGSDISLYRQGGSATNWDTEGATNYIINKMQIQCGGKRWNGGAADNGSFTVTLPTAFLYYPIVFSQCRVILNISTSISGADTRTEITINWHDVLHTNHTVLDFVWFAIGPPVL